MKERERVLELVKKGILTSEEALILLENMATEKDEKQIEKAAEKVDTQNIGTTNKEDQVADLMDALEKGEAEGPTVDSFEENTQDSAEKDRENLERILDELATKANRASAELDEVNAEIAGIKEEIKEVAEEIGTLDTKEELDALTEDEQVQRKDLHVLLAQLEEKLATQSTEKTALEEELKNIRKEQWKGQWNDTKEKVSLVAGGPMMGGAVTKDEVCVGGSTNAVTVLEYKEIEAVNCLRCGQCVEHCPSGLQPVNIANAFKANDIDRLEKLRPMDCIECGMCTYICPSKIEVTENVRRAKRTMALKIKK